MIAQPTPSTLCAYFAFALKAEDRYREIQHGEGFGVVLAPGARMGHCVDAKNRATIAN